MPTKKRFPKPEQEAALKKRKPLRASCPRELINFRQYEYVTGFFLSYLYEDKSCLPVSFNSMHILQNHNSQASC
jgi:hypothetical protein